MDTAKRLYATVTILAIVIAAVTGAAYITAAALLGGTSQPHIMSALALFAMGCLISQFVGFIASVWRMVDTAITEREKKRGA